MRYRKYWTIPIVHWTRYLLAAILLVLCIVSLSGCMQPADLPNGRTVHTEEPKATSGMPDATPEMSNDIVPNENRTTPILPDEGIQQSATVEPITDLSTPVTDPDEVYLCYDGTFSMMGFADIYGMNEYSSILSMVESSLAANFANSDTRYLRISREDGYDDLKTVEEQSLISTLSFYLNRDLLEQPAQVVLQGVKGVGQGTRMNEPVKSFYHALGQSEPTNTTETGSPASQAMQNLKGNSFLVLITDLEELQISRSLLSEIGEQVYAQNMVMGIAAVKSSFSGFFPIWSKGSPIWFEWGAQPTGSCEMMFDYTDYRIGLTIEPEKRMAEPRPFYVIFFGRSDCVNSFMQSLESQMSTSKSPFETFVFETSFSPVDYSILDHINAGDISVSNYGINILAKSDEKSVCNIQLEGLPGDDRAADGRWIQIPLSFQPRATDPRQGAFTADDFNISTYLSPINESGKPSGTMESTGAVVTSLAVDNRPDEDTILSVKCMFPKEKLSKGQYILHVLIQLRAPEKFANPTWMNDYNLALDNMEILQLTDGSIAFDGSKTIGLSTFLSGILEYQTQSVSSVNIGEYSMELSVSIP